MHEPMCELVVVMAWNNGNLPVIFLDSLPNLMCFLYAKVHIHIYIYSCMKSM